MAAGPPAFAIAFKIETSLFERPEKASPNVFRTRQAR
jgi:hypothetical protein